MGKWIAAGGFPFGVLRISGVFFILLGLALIGLGVADVVYSVYTYHTKYNCNSALKKTQLGTNIDPCDNNDIMIYTWVASPIWGGFLITVTGIVGAALTPTTHNLKSHRDAYASLVAVCSCLISVVIIILSSLDIIAGKDVFIKTVSGNLEVLDTLKFILPLVSSILALLVMVLGIIVLFYVCLCAQVYKDDEGRGRLYTYQEKSTKRHSRRKAKPLGVRRSAEQQDMVRVPGYPAFNNPAYGGYPVSAIAYAPYRPGLMPGLHPYYNQNSSNYQPFRYQNYSSLPTNLSARQPPLGLQQTSMTRQGFASDGYVPKAHYPTMPKPTTSGSLATSSTYMPGQSRTKSYKKPGTLEDIDETIDQMFDFTDELGDSDSGWEGGGSSKKRKYINI